jgi:putative tricarboxylic transport membrane protein
VSTDSPNTKPERRPDWAALTFAIFLFCLALIVASDALRIPAVAQYARIGPQTIPFAIAIGLAGLSVWGAIEALRGDFPAREPQERLPVLWIVGGLLVQLLTIRFIGFSIATGLLFALVARGFDERRFWISVPAGIILATIVWVIFARGLALTLPHGPLEDALMALFTPRSA